VTELLRWRVVAGLVHADVPLERARMVQAVRIKLRWIILEMWGGWKYGSGSEKQREVLENLYDVWEVKHNQMGDMLRWFKACGGVSC